MLLAGLVAGKRVMYEEPIRTRDHTERMLRGRGIEVRSSGTRVELTPGHSLEARDTEVPGDPSSAAFFVALAAMADAGSLRLDNVCVNDTRTGFLTVVQRMGAIVRYNGGDSESGEVVSPIEIEPGTLRAVQVGGEQVPSMIDELPMLACLAARAEGETRITDANELRVKESDRITAVVSNLRAIGVEAHELPDGMTICGSDHPLRGRVVTHGDHRLAMAFGILGAASGNSIEIDDPDCVTVSYPNFWDDLKRVRSE
jgi:3-phosphoshikimate 1-carboxyvinyltransferase